VAAAADVDASTESVPPTIDVVGGAADPFHRRLLLDSKLLETSALTGLEGEVISYYYLLYSYFKPFRRAQASLFRIESIYHRNLNSHKLDFGNKYEGSNGYVRRGHEKCDTCKLLPNHECAEHDKLAFFPSAKLAFR